MKKSFIALLLIMMLILSACGQPSGEPSKSAPTEKATEKATEAAVTEAVTEADDQSAEGKALSALKTRLEEAGYTPGSDALVFMRSYDTNILQIKNTAFTYDNALAAMAFTCAGCREEAESLLDSFVYAIANDRYKPGMVRNAYACGYIAAINTDNTPMVNLPGWMEGGEWKEDASQVGCSVGNTSYAAMAMLRFDEVFKTDKFLPAAKQIMDWVIDECSDGSDGFTAGFEGWPESDSATVFKYKSTEHNIDAYAAFTQLYAACGEEKYKTASESALNFVKSMYDPGRKLFRTGTDGSGGINDKVVVLDTQSWSALALGDGFEPYSGAIDTIKSMKTDDGGYPFCQENKNGGWWAEGTAFTALMFSLRGDEDEYASAMDALRGIQLPSGLFPAATVDNLSTGMELSDGSPWEYKDDPHVAPTAWFVMAANGFNPYALD